MIRESIYADLPVSVRCELHREAAARSPDAAADLLDRAAGLMDPADGGRHRLLAERASSLMLAGQIEDAEAACRQLLDRSHDPLVEGPVRICLGHALLAAGRAHDALQELERAGESQALTTADRAYGLAWASFACIMLGDLGRAVAVAEQARSAAADGDHLALSIHLTEALEIIDDAVRLADQSPAREEHRFQLQLPRAHILLELDRLEEARAAVEGARRISDEFGVRWHLPSYQAARGVERFIAGEWDDAIAELEASVALADETGSRYSLMYALGVRGDQPAPGRPPRRSASRSRRRSPAVGHRPALSRAVGAEVTEVVAEFAARNQAAALTGGTLRCRGLTEDDPGVLLAAVKAYGGGQRPLALALAAEDAGAAFARHGDAGRARPLLEQATEIYERLDAARDLARAEAALRQAGISRGRRGARKRPGSAGRA